MARLDQFVELQNPDGGWSYREGGTWTEPTCYALLAMHALGLSQTPEFLRGVAWLRSVQRPDGGWSPREPVTESTWVTALPVLLPREVLRGLDVTRAGNWLLAQTGEESGWTFRVRQWMLGVRAEVSQQFDGWPWYPGAAAWVAPTALSLLALGKLFRAAPGDARIRKRMDQGKAFLLARRCADGGWNHGSTRALGYDAGSYPETTGLALLALHDVPGSEIGTAVSAAERHLAACQSLEAQSWLRLGLLARGRSGEVASAIRPQGGVMESALAVLAAQARQGRNLFLE